MGRKTDGAGELAAERRKPESSKKHVNCLPKLRVSVFHVPNIGLPMQQSWFCMRRSGGVCHVEGANNVQ
jgi:hypothetical protein